MGVQGDATNTKTLDEKKGRVNSTKGFVKGPEPKQRRTTDSPVRYPELATLAPNLLGHGEKT